MSDPVAEAKAVLASHEQLAMAGDLDGVMTNMAEDIVVLAAGSPLVSGREAFREFYASLLATGDQEFGHDYSGAEVVGDLVVLHGVSSGTISPADGEPIEYENGFIHVLRRGADGQLRVWRAAFGPTG